MPNRGKRHLVTRELVPSCQVETWMDDVVASYGKRGAKRKLSCEAGFQSLGQSMFQVASRSQLLRSGDRCRLNSSRLVRTKYVKTGTRGL
eukprot:5410001-Pleurochrysis_carterae.AAC.2